MPIEIRELIIKTEISTTARNNQPVLRAKDLNILKKTLIEECKRIIADRTKGSSYKR